MHELKMQYVRILRQQGGLRADWLLHLWPGLGLRCAKSPRGLASGQSTSCLSRQGPGECFRRGAAAERHREACSLLFCISTAGVRPDDGLRVPLQARVRACAHQLHPSSPRNARIQGLVDTDGCWLNDSCFYFLHVSALHGLSLLGLPKERSAAACRTSAASDSAA